MGKFKKLLRRIPAAKKYQDYNAETNNSLEMAKKLLLEVEVLNKKNGSLREAESPDVKLINKNHSVISNKLDEAKNITADVNSKIDIMRGLLDRWELISSFFLLFIFVFLLYISPESMDKADSININFYIVVAQIIPVLLIAMSVYSLKTKNTKKAYLADLIGYYIPIIVGLSACLISIAVNKAFPITFVAALYALMQLIYRFCLVGYFDFTVSKKTSDL